MDRAPSGPGASLDPKALRQALVETGAIGSTVRQIAGRMGANVPPVAAALTALEERGEVLRLGRGLWVLRDFSELSEREDFADPASYAERFHAESGVGLGTYRGPITFRANEELPVHRWWPYVQGYSAEFVADLLRRAELPDGRTVLDPFCGSGTTLVEVRRAGCRAIGYELLPPSALAARVKTRFELDPTRFEAEARSVERRARARKPGRLPFLRETAQHFLPDVLADLLRLRDALPSGDASLAEALRLTFGRILIPVSRLRRSPCLGYGPTEKPRREVFPSFATAAAEMATDLRALRRDRGSWGPAATVVEGDARGLELPKGSVDLAVTSPPYVNGMDYVMNYKLDLAWLGYASSYADLSRLRTAQVSCDNLRRDEAARYLQVDPSSDPWLKEILTSIERNVRTKGSYRRQDVHGIVNRYFADLRPVLAGVYRALAPGGKFVLVIGDSLLAGTYIPGDLLVARQGAELGFEVASVEVARTRRSGQRRSFRLRESIVTLVKPTAAA
ncbi:MAG: site-specific DNA-methyltransferase [Thermoplasmata archaeon]|nr:site-specific DNA-methyltransferase [Thermoplasmata archaeon]